MQRAGERLILSASDLTAFVACEHRSRLDRLVADGLLDRPVRDDPELEVLRRRGDRHEHAELARLRAEGRQVVEIAAVHDLELAASHTEAAMRAGAEVIFHATFFDGRWRGHADFLRRVEEPSDLGAWAYEVADTKLARRAKPSALLQLASYAVHVRRLQGAWPPALEVVTGDGERHRFAAGDVAAYARAAMARLEAAVAGPAVLDTYPEPCEHCSVCPWLERCEAERAQDDHLSLVAGVRRDMVVKLRRAGIGTLAALAGSPVGEAVPGMGQPTADRLRRQARLQLAQRAGGAVLFELLEPEEGRGLFALPAPSPGDLFFDMEGDPWAGDHGIEYLFGAVDADGAFHEFWGHDEAGERAAFEGFVDLVVARLRRHPDMHVYHFASYEATALRRLAGRHGTRELEVDRLLRGGVLVDLYRVVRHGLLVGQDGYGLKKLEALYRPPREGELKDGASSIVWYEDWLEGGDDRLLHEIRRYNQDDCESTRALRDWLEARRGELPEPPRRAEPPPADAPDEVADADARTAALAADVAPLLPLLADLLWWHRRESRPEWWTWFDRLERTDEELVRDGECIGELAYEGVVAETGRSLVHRYRYEQQEHRFGRGDRPADPRTGRFAGEVVKLDVAAGTIDLKRAASSDAPHPRSIIPPKPYDNRVLADAVARVAEAALDGKAPQALADLLSGRPPRVLGVDEGADLTRVGEPGADALVRLAPRLLGACLAVQGPPGSGKTFTGAKVVVDAVEAGKRVGITAQSHRAIGNLLRAVAGEAHRRGVAARIVQKASEGDACGAPGVECVTGNSEVDDLLARGAVDVVGGTAWLFARKELDGVLDLLVVDEAGQLSLANVVAVGGSARNLVLLGDPQQLAQVSRGSHPAGAGVSGLEHVIAGAASMPPDRGLLLERSHRMHPAICGFVSELAYDGRLVAEPACAGQEVADGPLLSGAGLRWVPVAHDGNRTRSDEEAAVVARLVDALVGRPWTAGDGQQSWLGLEDILVIAPYNAQVAALAEALPRGARVGTVDRFQGQEAPVALYSLAASSAEDVPRGIDFLLSVNRLNVAVSRARALAVVVGSPALLRAPCRSVHQLRLVNALCRYVEVATAVTT